ncbi:MAG: DNA translocase FtsK, partial [Pseudomonadota bacterium]
MFGLVSRAIAAPLAGFVCITAGVWMLIRGLGLTGEDLRLAWTIDQPRTAVSSQADTARSIRGIQDLPKPPPLPDAAKVSRWMKRFTDAGMSRIKQTAARMPMPSAAEDQPPSARFPNHGLDHVHPARDDEPAGHDDLVPHVKFATPDHERPNGSGGPGDATARDRAQLPIRDRDFDAFYDGDDGDELAVDGLDEHFDGRGIAERFAPRSASPSGSAPPTRRAGSMQRSATVSPSPKQKQAPVAPSHRDVDTPQQSNSPARPTSKARTARSVANGYRPPGLDLLERGSRTKPGLELSQTVLRGNARLLEDVLADFGVKGTVREIHPGPVITLYELEIARGIKASRVIGLADDIARSMSAPSARIDTIPGRNTLGIELPNMTRSTVRFRDILEDATFRSGGETLPLALGKSIGGAPVVADLASMPHLLVAGTTGSGKSVGVNAMILSLLYRYGPDRLRFIMIDPKMLELSIYNGIPHLLTPVVTDPNKAIVALNWAIREMEERYKRMAELGVRNITAYNTRVTNAAKQGQSLNERVQTGFDAETGEAVYAVREVDLTPLPHIVVVVDEFADLMIVAGKEIDAAIQRLAQMARAAGIHLIMATQRPSVDIVTGTIKANFPTRIGFKVASKIDSRTIINAQGAEQLLGQGDMLLSDGSGKLMRVHGAYVSDDEVEAVAAHVRQQPGPGYVDAVVAEPEGEEVRDERPGQTGEDLYDKAVATVLRDRKASTSYL